MKKIIITLTFILSACSVTILLPEASITIKSVDENGEIIKDARVGIGFEINTGSGTKEIPVIGYTDDKGMFTGSAKALKDVGYNVRKEGYYISTGKYRFENKSVSRWMPWNPEIKVVLRKIINPVSMYARRLDVIIPSKDQDIGFDLIQYDWVKPYGKGENADIIFNLKKRYKDINDYDAILTLKFNNNDGITKIDENMSSGSVFKMPRFAPEAGYQKIITKYSRQLPGKPYENDYKDNVGYIFRIRSSEKQGKFVQAMYGKIQGDVEFRAKGPRTAGISFSYYLNPDYSRNLEYDLHKNIFKDLNITEMPNLIK